MADLPRFIKPNRLNLSFASSLVGMTFRARWAALSMRRYLSVLYMDSWNFPKLLLSAETSLKASTPAFVFFHQPVKRSLS